MLARDLGPHARALARRHPVLAVTGPRQSGKTTFCRAEFPEHAYVSLESPDERRFALEDPRGFLARYPAGAILDAPVEEVLPVLADMKREGKGVIGMKILGAGRLRNRPAAASTAT